MTFFIKVTYKDGHTECTDVDADILGIMMKCIFTFLDGVKVEVIHNGK